MPSEFEDLEGTIFYKLERAIKAYRQFAQREIRIAGFQITIDQWLILKTLLENPGIGQHDVADKVFKDKSSVTRIIDMMVKDGYLERETDPSDRRRTTLNVTEAGGDIVAEINAVIAANRKWALQGTEEAEIWIVTEFLELITKNCSE